MTRAGARRRSTPWSGEQQVWRHEPGRHLHGPARDEGPRVHPLSGPLPCEDVVIGQVRDAFGRPPLAEVTGRGEHAQRLAPDDPGVPRAPVRGWPLVQQQLARLVEVRERVLDLTGDEPQLRRGAVRHEHRLDTHVQRHPDRLEGADDPGGLSRGGPRVREHRSRALEQRSPLFHHDAARGGQPNSAGVPVQQGHADLGFQPLEAPAQQRSRYTELARGGLDGPAVHCQEQHPEPLVVHAPPKLPGDPVQPQAAGAARWSMTAVEQGPIRKGWCFARVPLDFTGRGAPRGESNPATSSGSTAWRGCRRPRWLRGRGGAERS